MSPKFSNSAADKAAILVEALPWIRSFRGKIFVIKLGGNAIGNGRLIQAFADDVLFLHSVGVRPIILFGGGPQISKALEKSGIQSLFVDGYRVTPPEAITIIMEVLHKQIGSELQKHLDRHSKLTEILSGEDHGLLKAKRVITDSEGNPIDIGLVGEVVDVKSKPILDLLDQGKIPILSSLGPDLDGDTMLNINADSAAAAVAVAVRAEKLVLLTNVGGLYSDWPKNKKLISTILISDLQKILPNLSTGMIPKMSACLRAVSSGVPKAAVIDGRTAHSLLLEVFTKSGVGTEVVAQ